MAERKQGARAVFTDRDGVLNQLVFNPLVNEYESPYRVADLELLPGVPEALRRLQSAGFLTFIVSNQPSYAKGKQPLENLQAVAAELERRLAAEGAAIQRAYYCLHHPQGVAAGYSGPCECRKPAAGMLFRARDEFGLDLSRCWMIGDQDSDVECGRRAGCRTVAVQNPLSAHRRPGLQQPAFAAADLSEAAARILEIDP